MTNICVLRTILALVPINKKQHTHHYTQKFQLSRLNCIISPTVASSSKVTRIYSIDKIGSYRCAKAMRKVKVIEGTKTKTCYFYSRVRTS